MTDLNDFQIKISRKIIIFSFVFSTLIDLIPLSYNHFFWLPEFTSLILLYWAIHQPQRVSVGIAFIIGLILDISMPTALGQHALSYVIMVYLIQNWRRQMILWNYGFQSIAITLILLISQLIILFINLMSSHYFNNWLIFSAVLTGGLLWPLINKIMIKILNSSRIK